MSRSVILGLLLATVVALALRWPELDRRVMHGDEAVHAVKFSKLWEEGSYKYDPNEYHGPTLYYFTFAWAKLTGAPGSARFHDGTLRMVTVVFGVGLILLLPLVADGLGRGGTFWAGLLTALSPAMVYYSRYYIHEIPLVFFTFLALAAGWRYTRTWKIGWAMLAGGAIGLMHGTKETFVFTMAAAVGALILNWFWSRKEGQGEAKAVFNGKHAAAALAVWLGVVVVFFSSFFTNWVGVIDSVRTYVPWVQRAGGASPHMHPWYFYFSHLAYFHSGSGPVFSEGLILGLCVVGLFAALTGKGLGDAHKGFVRFVGIYTIALTGVYCLIGYKTPWCLLSFWHGMILLAGLGAMALVRCAPWKPIQFAVIALLLAGAGQLGVQAWRADTTYCADRRNPYVYAHTSEDFLNLVSKLKRVSLAHCEGHDMMVKVMAPESDYWPLPWYLREFTQIGYWNEVPADPYAPVMVVSAKLQAGVATTFLVGDIKDFFTFAKRLCEHTDPVSEFLWNRLDSGTRQKLADVHSPSTDTNALHVVLLQYLNNVITGKALNEDASFKQVNLREVTQQMAARKLEGEKVARLNRLLLEDAYPELARSQVGLDDRMTHLMVGLFQLRTQNFLELYVESKLWQKYLEQNKGQDEE